MIELAERTARIVEAIVQWARTRQDIRGIALVGSHARGTARPNSDIDLMVLTSASAALRADRLWVETINWSRAGVEVAKWSDEEYGAVWSRRVQLGSGLEVEITVAPLSWAGIAPIDEGTRRIISEGCRVLHDPDALLTRLGAHLREGLSGCLVRLATPGDTPNLRRAVVELQEYERRLHGTRLPGEQIADAYLVWLRQQVAHDGFVLIAEVGGTFAGFVAGWVAEEANLTETADSNRVGYVSDVCVMPAYRGRHIAAELLLAIERHLTQSGISRMRLASLVANASAQTAYRRAGYAPYEIIFEKCIGGRSGVSPLNQFDSLGPLPIGDARCRSAICREVIESLPDWFGIPASNQAFVAAAEELPMLACFAPDGEVLGFVSMKARTPIATELYVLGVKRTWHRRGVGRRLIEAVARLAALDGIRFLTVKTLAPSKPDPNYDATRRFYEAMGFLPIEEFPTLWNPENPCPADAAASGALAPSALS